MPVVVATHVAFPDCKIQYCEAKAAIVVGFRLKTARPLTIQEVWVETRALVGAKGGRMWEESSILTWACTMPGLPGNFTAPDRLEWDLLMLSQLL